MRGGGGSSAVGLYTHEALGHRRLKQATHTRTQTHGASAEVRARRGSPGF